VCAGCLASALHVAHRRRRRCEPTAKSKKKYNTRHERQWIGQALATLSTVKLEMEGKLRPADYPRAKLLNLHPKDTSDAVVKGAIILDSYFSCSGERCNYIGLPVPFVPTIEHACAPKGQDHICLWLGIWFTCALEWPQNSIV
jgi:hypothetical protein